MNHFTNESGYKAISSQPIWKFKAVQPPKDNPLGAYFTTLDVDAPRLAARLGIPRAKLAFLFKFTGDEGLVALKGGRGKYIFYSPVDYDVPQARQAGQGPTGL